MDEELAQTIGKEIHDRIADHLGKLKEAYGDDLTKDVVLFDKYKLADASAHMQGV